MRLEKLIRLNLLNIPKNSFLWLIFLFTIPANAQKIINPHFSNFTINNGLSQSLIYSITQDTTGFMWFGTKDGLNRFDGYEFKIFHHDPFDPVSIADNVISELFTDKKGRLWVGTMNGSLDLYDSRKNIFTHYLENNINKGNINAITEDPSGNLWVGTYGNGIFKLVFKKTNHSNRPDTVIHYFNIPGDTTSLISNLVIDVFADKEGGIWASTTKTLFQYAKPDGMELKFSVPTFQLLSTGKKIIPHGIQFSLSGAEPIPVSEIKFGGVRFIEDPQGRIWMAAPGGLLLFDRNEKKLFLFDPLMPGLVTGNIRSVCKNSFSGKQVITNSLWMGMIAGPAVINTKDLTFQYFSHDPLYSKSVLSGSILCVYKDRSGSLWFGTSGSGLSEYDTHATLFPMPDYHTADGKIRTENLSVRSFLDTKNYLFIGTQSSLMMADKSTRQMEQINLGNNPLESNTIFSIAAADSDNCWIAANSGLYLYNFKNHSKKKFFTEIQKNGNGDGRIFKIYIDSKKNLWCLTPYSFSFFNTRLKTFKKYFFNNNPVNGFTEPTYGDIYQAPDGNFWIGTGEGLLYFDTTAKKFTRYVTNSSNPNSLSFTAVRAVLPDPKKPSEYLWIATAGGGLNQLDLRTKKFIHYTEKNGLPNNFIYGILSDENGNLWMSTNKGISMFNPSSKSFTNYDINAGLQSNEFNSGAFYKNNDGELFFGGINGFNVFTPGSIKGDNQFPQLAFTGFSIFNHPVSVDDKNSPLKYSITETKKIVLPYSDNIISFKVAALDFSEPEKKQYAYKLEPSNKDWIQLGSNRLITFSNLEPGNYTLRVKAGNLNGAWNEQGISLNLVIMPPWWRTWWAYLLYICIAIALLYYLRKYELRGILLRNKLKVEQMESHKLKELDHLKSRFFANISHEFRTPLTLIMGPVEDLLKTGDAEQFKKILPEVHRNSVRLLQLINQLLDLSKLDAKRYRINMTREDIIPFVEQVVHSFSSLAERKNIDLKIIVDPALRKMLDDGETKFYFDEDMIEKIINNLLSNAFKFTGENGRITVGMKSSEKKNGYLELSVKDSGIGIPKEKLSYIFDRFYQADDSDERHYEGSGVGLALLKELVDLLQGEATVTSETGKGTTFYCYLPFNNRIISEKTTTGLQTQKIVTPVTIIDEHVEDGQETGTKGKDLILIVDDYADVRKYIRRKIENTYAVAEASNGEEGLELARAHVPDLVVSDVMMPGMDGFELCEKLKTDNLTSHIPVILLTAKAEDSDKMTGLSTGADAYLTKPFNSQELNIRIRNLIELRKKLRAKFSDKLVVKPSEITVTSMDREFMKTLLSIVEDHISDAKFSVTELGSAMNMSVSQLNRKLKAIIDQSPQKFIRSIRMQRALEMLKKNSGNISEISWEVGFEDPGYFSRVFKSHFGYSPSDVKCE